MALKVLMMKRELEKKKERLEELRSKTAEFEKREAELEKAIDEVSTEEEKNVLDAEITKFDTEKSDFEKEVKDLEKEVSDTENDLAAEEQKGVKAAEVINTQSEEGKRGKEIIMSKRKKFYGMNMEERSSFMQRDDVKDFATRTRELMKQQRTVTGAELTIPEIMLELIRDNLDRYSKLLNKVNLRKLKGKARQNILGTIPEGIWTEMIDSVNEITFGLNQIEVDGYKVGGYIPVPNSMIEDSDENLVEIVMDMISQALGLALDKAIVYGKGAKMPLGIVTRLAQTTKPSDWSTKAPEWKDLHTTNILKFATSSMKGSDFLAKIITLSGLPKENYSKGNMFWLMNKTTKTSVLAKLVTANATGAFVASMNNEMPITGGEIITLPFIPDGDIIFGYNDLYLLVERSGATFALSEHAQFIEENTLFKGTARYDGEPVLGEAFVAININDVDVTLSIKFAAIKEEEVTPPQE